MKKIIFLLGMWFFYTGVKAQKEDKSAFDKSIIVKWSPASLAFGKIGLGSEFNFKEKKSITFNVGIPFEKTLTADIDGEDRSLMMKTFSVMAGYRMYFGSKPMNGLYFEPYLKYLKNEATTNTDFEIDGTNRPFLVTSEYSGVGVGAQLGVQFLIAKRVAIDFYFLGPEANSSNHDLIAQETGSGLPWSNAEAQDAENEINDFVNDIPLLKDNLDVTVNAAGRNVKTNYSGFLPGIRFGLSIGIRF
ncbi:hypothetical protein CAP36_07605 [Chitinophagaceae bacterium IBVUCB2]|nr:hypothetical protein CAP36_07605 [Chitinophagaceae bacterium IBVUCB2]